jgi:ATP-binding cassette, subfamily B (MDR/TAP), member 1
VQQEPVLFSISIRENIRLGRLDASDEEVKNAAKSANVHNFISKLTDNYDTIVGERGVNLSGGQKQRIAIARALLRNPSILLLDEATSALDYESEKIVQAALEKAKIGRTTIIIAHRLSTIKNADSIVCLSEGKVAEMGTHDQLMNQKGVYYKLVCAQKAEESDEQKSERKNPLDKKLSSASYKEEDDITETAILDEQSESEQDQLEKSKTSFFVKNMKLSRDSLGSERKKSQLLFKYERFLFKMNRNEMALILLGIVAQLMNGAIFPIVAILFSDIYAIFLIPDKEKQKNISINYMLIIIVLGIVNGLVVLVYNIVFGLSGARLTKRIRVKMFESMLRQEIGFHDLDENKSSILTTKLATYASFCKGLTTEKLSLLSQGFAGVGLSVIVGFLINWKLCLVVMVFIPITFISGVISGRSSTNTKVKGKLNIEEGGRLSLEIIENIKTVVSLNRERYFLDEFEQVFEHEFKKTLCYLHIQAIFYSISNSIVFFIQSTSFAYGYYLVKYENLSVNDLYKVYATITFSSLILGRVYSQMPDQNRARQSTKIAYKIINRKSKIDAFTSKGIVPKWNHEIGNIRFLNVNFSYPTRKYLLVLNKFNLDINSQEINALVGPSGSGKLNTILLREFLQYSYE